MQSYVLLPKWQSAGAIFRPFSDHFPTIFRILGVSISRLLIHITNCCTTAIIRNGLSSCESHKNVVTSAKFLLGHHICKREVCDKILKVIEVFGLATF